jgi:hypothetical protein
VYLYKSSLDRSRPLHFSQPSTPFHFSKTPFRHGTARRGAKPPPSRSHHPFFFLKNFTQRPSQNKKRAIRILPGRSLPGTGNLEGGGLFLFISLYFFPYL